MTLISDTIPNLVNGVSQQAEAVRLASQCETQENLHSSIVDNLSTRAPTKTRARLVEFDVDTTKEDALSAATHIINRDATEQYRVLIINDEVKVFELDGTEKTVATPDGTDYLTSSNQRDSIRAISIKDHTFIVNTEVEVAMDETIYNTPVNEAMLFIKLANYDTKIEVTLDGHTVTFSTDAYGYGDSNHIAGPDGNGTSSAPVAIDTAHFANCIAQDFIDNHPDSSDYEIEANRAIVSFKRVDGGDFDLKVEDTRSDTQASVLKGRANKISDLPTRATNNFYIQLEQDDANDFDDYYVKFETHDGSDFGEGIWREVPKVGIKTKLDASTMPHILVRESDGNFTFKEAIWDDRIAGDETSSPEPSFVGHKINDLFLERNRLGILSDINVIMSRDRELFAFWPSTVTTSLDTDPIDKSPSNAGVSILYNAVSQRGELIFFSEQGQFILDYDDNDSFSNKTVDIKPLTHYSSKSKAKPVTAGKVVFFPINKGSFSGVLEYYMQDDVELSDASDITAAIPSYIPSGITKMTASTTSDILMAITPEDPRVIYVYKYYWTGNEKIQSAWSKYPLYENEDGSEIISIHFIDTILHLTVVHEDGVYAEEMDFSPASYDPGHTYVNCLDRRVDETQCVMTYDSMTNTTTIELPFVANNTNTDDYRMVIRSDADGFTQGAFIYIMSISGNEVTVAGDLTDAEFYIGSLYTQIYIPSPQFLKEASEGGGFKVITTGRLQMKKWKVNFVKTGSFTVTVTPDNSPSFVYRYTGTLIGTSTATIGVVNLSDGHFEFAVAAENTKVEIKFESRSHIPISLVNIEWLADYNTIAGRA